jgi:PIN domain nuclease of toxin-antitoxin system
VTPTHVADAHALLWYLFAPERMGAAAASAMDRANAGEIAVVIPAVVLAEAMMVLEKQRLPGVDAARGRATLRLLPTSRNWIVAPLTADTVLSSHALAMIPDIFDRLIVTEASLRRLPLLTKDGTIIASGAVTTVWD